MSNGSFNQDDIATIRADVRDLQTTMYGDARRKIVGVVETMNKLLEAEDRRILRDEKRDALQRGILIGLGLTGITSASTLVTVLFKVFTGIP